MWDSGRLRDAVERMDRSFRVLADEEPDADLAALAAQLGRFQYFAGDVETARERIEIALDIAEGLWLPEILSAALTTKGIILYSGLDRRREGFALLKYALDVALENDVPQAALRAYYNLSDLAQSSDRYLEGREYLERGLTLARRIGNRYWEMQMLGQVYSFYALGDWDQALAMMGELPRDKVVGARGAYLHFNEVVPRIHFLRGDPDAARNALEVFPAAATSDDVQERASHAIGQAFLLRSEGKAREALECALSAFDARHEMGIGSEFSKEAFAEAVEAAFELDDLEKVEELVGVVEAEPPGKRSRTLHGHTLRFRARLAHARGEEEAGALFERAAEIFRELAVPFWLAVTLLERAEWLIAMGKTVEEEALAEAREIFERLKATPWLDRVNALAIAPVTAARDGS
jgi:tetratricopeptide (TPR) repeat protein